MIETTKKKYQTEALAILQEIGSSENKAYEIVDNLISNWSKTNYYFECYGFPVINEKDIKSEDLSSFVRKTSKDYNEFLSEAKSEKLSDELFGYKIPFDKKKIKFQTLMDLKDL